jgi:dipeptidyl aminopeptidase/acylaminoacyl peptidase
MKLICAFTFLVCSAAALSTVSGPVVFSWSEAALSPDGKQLATLDGAGLSIMDLESRRTVGLLPSGRAGRNLTFSPDGKSLYFIGPENALQRYTFSDGAAKKILAGLDGPFAISPDGRNVAFVRREKERSDADLMIANSNGREERKLTTFPAAKCRLWFPAAEMAVIETVGVGLSQQFRNRLAAIAVDTGERKNLLSQDGMMRMIWPPGKAGLFALRVSGGTEYRTYLGQVWRRQTLDAPWRQLTQDAIGFQDLIGVSADGSTIAVKRPMLSDISFEGFMGTITSWMQTRGRMAISPRNIRGFELVILHVGQ